MVRSELSEGPRIDFGILFSIFQSMAFLGETGRGVACDSNTDKATKEVKRDDSFSRFYNQGGSDTSRRQVRVPQGMPPLGSKEWKKWWENLKNVGR